MRCKVVSAHQNVLKKYLVKRGFRIGIINIPKKHLEKKIILFYNVKTKDIF